MFKLPKILPQPKLPESLSNTARWLSGEGAGSWFIFLEGQDSVGIRRYSPCGNLECEGEFKTNELFYLEQAFTVTYPSHCLMVSVLQEGRMITLKRI